MSIGMSVSAMSQPWMLAPTAHCAQSCCSTHSALLILSVIIKSVQLFAVSLSDSRVKNCMQLATRACENAMTRWLISLKGLQ